MNLSPREREVLAWIAAGKTYGEIATILGIKRPTVHTYVTMLRTKLDVVNLPQAVAKCYELGILGGAKGPSS